MQHFYEWQIEHYEQLLARARAEKNWKWVGFLKNELQNLKKR